MMKKLVSKINRGIFRFLKKIKLLKLLKKDCQGLIQPTIDGVDEIYGDKKINIKIYKLVEQEDVEIKPATCLPEDELMNFKPFKVKAEWVLLDIANREFSFRNNHILDEKFNVIYEPGIPVEGLPISGEYLASCKKRINGTVAYLSNTWPKNYGHWLIYTLPLIRIYWKFIGKENIDYYYVGDGAIEAFQIETLAKVGINKEQILNYPCKADRALTVVKNRENQNGGIKYTEFFSFRFVSSLFLRSCNKLENIYPGKRIYVKRGDVKYRKVINEDEILNYLKSLGFVVVVMEGRTVQEQADIFYSSDVIVAPHGSALTNLLFVRPNTKVIELLPDNYPDPFVFNIASYAKTDFYYVKGEKTFPDNISPQMSDIKVDIHKLEQICKIAKIDDRP